MCSVYFRSIQFWQEDYRSEHTSTLIDLFATNNKENKWKRHIKKKLPTWRSYLPTYPAKVSCHDGTFLLSEKNPNEKGWSHKFVYLWWNFLICFLYVLTVYFLRVMWDGSTGSTLGSTLIDWTNGFSLALTLHRSDLG